VRLRRFPNTSWLTVARTGLRTRGPTPSAEDICPTQSVQCSAVQCSCRVCSSSETLTLSPAPAFSVLERWAGLHAVAIVKSRVPTFRRSQNQSVPMADFRSPTSIHPALTNPHPLPLASINEVSPPSPPYKSAGVQSLATSVPNALKSITQCGESLQRERAPEHLAALNTKRYSYDLDNDPSESSFSAATTVGQNSPNDSASLPSSPVFPSSFKPAFTHRKNALSVESVPRQTIIKALASAGRNHNPQNLSLPNMIAGHRQMDHRPGLPPPRNCRLPCQISLTEQGPQQHLASLPYNHRASTMNDLTMSSISTRFSKRFRGMNGCPTLDYWQRRRESERYQNNYKRRPMKRAVRNVMIVTKARDNQLVNLTKELAMWLMSTPRYGSELGVTVYVDAKLKLSKRFGAVDMLEAHPRFQHLLRYWRPEMCRNQPRSLTLS